jgi:hypothetical protein
MQLKVIFSHKYTSCERIFIVTLLRTFLLSQVRSRKCFQLTFKKSVLTNQFPDRKIDLKNLADLLFGCKVFCAGSDENNVVLNESGQFFIRLFEQEHERIRITMDPLILLRLSALSDIALQRLFNQIYAPHSKHTQIALQLLNKPTGTLVFTAAAIRDQFHLSTTAAAWKSFLNRIDNLQQHLLDTGLFDKLHITIGYRKAPGKPVDSIQFTWSYKKIPPAVSCTFEI